jgi:lysophospholipase L1-like esterase
MIYNRVEFHNVSQVSTQEGLPGVGLHRIPESLRPGLNDSAKDVGMCPSQTEIRFVTDAPAPKLTLYSGGHHEYAFVYCGDFLLSEHCIEPNQSLTIFMEMPTGLRELDPKKFERFPAHVWRVRLSGTRSVHFVELDTAGHEVRPPTPEEAPASRWVAYGSSITHGFSASRLANPWTQLAATALRKDMLNLGFGGCCHAENAMADYLAERDDWDLCTLELGINLISNPITDDEFRQRCAYMMDRVATAHPRAKVVVITPFLNRQHIVGKRAPKDLHSFDDFRDILRDEVFARKHLTNLYLMEGRDVLDRADGLSADLCHPSDFGQAVMADNFVRLFKAL